MFNKRRTTGPQDTDAMQIDGARYTRHVETEADRA